MEQNRLASATGANAATTIRPAGFGQPVQALLPSVVDRLARELRPDRIILFGSYAYGTPTVDSDVDLLVVMETSASQQDRFLAVSRLLRPRPFPVDILVKTPDEMKVALQNGDCFVNEIVSRGKVLYERS